MEPLSIARKCDPHQPCPSQSWSSVIEQQVDLVKKSNIKATTGGTGKPFWALAGDTDAESSLEEVHTLRFVFL